MLDSILGLPSHPLIVHLPVVLLPLVALLLIALVVRPSWRPRFALPALGLLAVASLGAVAAKFSGSNLAERVGLPVEHANYGDATAITAGILLVVGGAWLWWVRRTEQPTGAQNAVGWVVLAFAGAVTVLTVLTGHSGATATWSDIDAEPAVGQSESAGYTMVDVEARNTTDECWAAVDGNVYDLTDWVSQHPGGADRIAALCGTDATAAFEGQHAGAENPRATLERHLLGPVN